MLIARQNAATRIPVRLVSSAGVPVTGMAPANVLGGQVLVVKGDGTTVFVTLTAGATWFEISSVQAPGLYHILVPGAALGTLGPTQLSVQPAASAFVGVIDSFLVEEFPATVDSTGAAVSALQATVGTPVGSSVSADIAALQSTANTVNTKLGAPVGASVSADIAAVRTAANTAAANAASAQTSAAAAAAAALLIRKIQTNRWKVFGNQLVFFDDDRTTTLFTFNLFDDTGAPNMTKVFERVPTP